MRLIKTLAIAMSFMILAHTATAQGNLLVNPFRVVFEGSKKITELNIANTGSDTAEYAISLTNIRMTKSGKFELIDTPDNGQRFANDYIRFFPKRVKLAPNEAQTVKVQLTQYNKLIPGEYRSHLYFRAIPREEPLDTGKHENTEGISVKMNAVFGISIPLIIRVGEPSVKVTLSNFSTAPFNDTLQLLNMTFNREGAMSAYGNLRVDYITPGGEAINVGEVKGIAVYTPNAQRDFTLKLNKKAGVNYKKGKLHIIYTLDIKSEKPIEAEYELN